MKLVWGIVLPLAALVFFQPHPTLDEYPRRVGIDVENYRFELTLSDTADQIDGAIHLGEPILSPASQVPQIQTSAPG